MIPNEITYNADNTVTIEITRRNGDVHHVVVDTVVFRLMRGLRWHVHAARHGRHEFYAATYLDGKLWLMHRLIIESWMDADRPEVDHVNGNGLDNRMANLRPADRILQMRNTRRNRTAL